MTKMPMIKVLMFYLGCMALCSFAHAESVTQISQFGENPTGIGMYLYTPTQVTAKPAVVVGVHACHGKGTDVCNRNHAFAQQADRLGFLLICPSAISSDGCWDVHSTKVMTHQGGGDAQGIISMVNYVLANKNGDASRVFVIGHSSGGMATNILLGSYPDVFQAGAAYAGVPFGCYGTGPVDNLGWNTNCAQGKIIKTGAEWASLVRNAYPGFTGTRPRIQLWHGTKDDVLFFQNFKEEIKQWTHVLGVSETPTTTENHALQSTWIRTRYKDAHGVVQVEAIEETGQPHNLIVDAAEAMRFFGLDPQHPNPDAGVADAGTDVLPDAVDGYLKSDTPTSTGGISAMGGTYASGGAISTGGMMALGGAVSSGGVVAAGGAVSTGGTVEFAGGKTTIGGVTADAGKVTAGGFAMGGTRRPTTNQGNSSGCSYSLSEQRSSIFVLGLFVVGLLLGSQRRRRINLPNP